MTTEKAYFASGCFWGTEYHFMKHSGVKETNVGYMGGTLDNPTYEDVCSGNTGHFETVEVIYDPNATSYEQLVELFFETHDFSQEDGQGPDIGSQYRSCIFFTNESQKTIAESYIDLLKENNFKVATEVRKSEHFWMAENYHQQYYHARGGRPYCHKYIPIFEKLNGMDKKNTF